MGLPPTGPSRDSCWPARTWSHSLGTCCHSGPCAPREPTWLRPARAAAVTACAVLSQSPACCQACRVMLRKPFRKTKSSPPSYRTLIFLRNLFLEFSHAPAQSGWPSGREPGRLPVSGLLSSLVLWAACVCRCHDPCPLAQVLSPG